MKGKAFIFDMDGTLLDTNGLWWQLPEALLRREGLDCPEDLRRRIGTVPSGVMTDALIEAGVLPYTAAEVWQAYFELLPEMYLQQARWCPGAEAFLQLLQARDIPRCVATATPVDVARVALGHCGALPYFSFVQSVHSLDLRKDDPRFFAAVAAQLGLPANQCVVVEDAVHAVRGAKAAGATVWAIADRYMAPNWPEIVALADESFSSYADMANHLLQII